MIDKPIKIKDVSGKGELEFVGGFSPSHSFVIGGFGRFGTGKSRFAVTGPDVTGIIPIDQKTRRTVEAAMKELDKSYGKNILMPPEDFIKYMRPLEAEAMDEAKSKEFYRQRVERVKEYAFALLNHRDVRLICLDTAWEFFDDIRYAHYGRTGSKFKKLDGDKKGYQDKSEAEREFRDFIRAMKSKPLLLMHPAKEEWAQPKPGADRKATGLDTWEGFKLLGHSCEAVVEFTSNPKYNPNDDEQAWKFRLNVRGCQANFELQGPDGNPLLEDGMITFNNLCSYVFPDAPEGMFE